MFFWIIVSFIGIVVVLASLGHKLSLNAGGEGDRLFKNLENIYEDYVRDYLNDRILQQNKWDLDEEEFRNNTKKILLPCVEAIFGHINATKLSDIKIKFQSKYFTNVIRIAESFYQKRYQTNDILGEVEFKKLLSALQNAIEADITHKILKLKGGIV